MQPTDIDRLIERLWQPAAAASSPGTDRVYAVVDCARDDRVYPAVQGARLPSACLFAGEIGEELARAAPYLVELQPGADFTRQILELGWGQSFGIFAASPAPLEQLRRHFRQFFRAQDERGKRLFFRYYDPRVFRVYLPTCNEGELKAMFGPLSRYCVEAEDPSKLIQYTLDGPNLMLNWIDWREGSTPVSAAI